jgi:hypothetical protein
MNVRACTRFLSLGALAVALVLTGYAGAHGGSHTKSGPKSSDPRLNGPRDMNYDHLIVPGDRVGPVKMGAWSAMPYSIWATHKKSSAAPFAAPATRPMRSITITKTNASSLPGRTPASIPGLKPVIAESM